MAYTFRRKQLAGRIEAVLHYIADDNVCRSRLLLAYFGEELMHSCRQCDVCLKRIPEKLPHSLLEDVAVLLEKTLTPENPSYTLNEFVSLLPESGEEALEALRIVLAQDNRYLLDGDTLIFRKS
ncbi:RecQ family zinc-binding domain-containing protein [Porphyromonas macacae]|uniref:RecQ family zinc-binding domain-containing protein n=1 Tax=Porphyromonas macacae TaxID=28115 RepID=UPI000AF20B84|nr:RecQ family zinc-binding domain-containing protein [Porphyromonas macacae]